MSARPSSPLLPFLETAAGAAAVAVATAAARAAVVTAARATAVVAAAAIALAGPAIVMVGSTTTVVASRRIVVRPVGRCGFLLRRLAVRPHRVRWIERAERVQRTQRAQDGGGLIVVAGGRPAASLILSATAFVLTAA